MQNTSKQLNKKTVNWIAYVFALFFCQITSLYAATPDNVFLCEKKLASQKNNLDLMSSACDAYGNQINLNYSRKSRRIWLTSNRFKQNQHTIKRLENGANPELVGADDDIRILFNRTIKLEEREFLILTIAERTSRGNGGGECGSGAEIYLNIFELNQHQIQERNSILIASCSNGIDLEYPNNDPKSKPLISLNNGTLQIKWSSHPKSKYDDSLLGPVIGTLNILDNELVMIPVQH
jgi:hypothetical protein